MTTYQSDEQILAQLQSGNERTYNEIYNAVRPKVIAFVQSRFGFDLDTAEDIFQDTFIVFYSKIQSGALALPLRSRLSTFILGIARNLSLKKRERTPLTVSEIPDQAVFPSVENTHNESYNKLVVSNLMNQINEDQRDLISLFFYKDYTPGAVAEELGIQNEGTVRKRKFDTLRKMRTIVKRNQMRA